MKITKLSKIKSDVIILIFCQTGFGDQYSSLITGYNAFLDLIDIGINPTIVISKGHKYFPETVDLSVIYDLSTFNTDVFQINHNVVDELTEGYELLLFTSIQIWVKKKTKKLENYVNTHKHISRGNRDLLSFEPNLDFNIYYKEVISFSDSLVFGKNDIIGIHFRGGDDTSASTLEEIQNHEYWGKELRRAMKIIDKFPNNDIMFCSLNKPVRKFILNEYKNVFSFDVDKNEIPLHNVVGNHEVVDDVEKYINHSKEILAEMISFRHCKKIYSFNTFSSNFVLYGIINNINYNDYVSKLNVSII